MTYFSRQHLNVRNALSKKKLQDVLSKGLKIHLLAKTLEKPLCAIRCAAERATAQLAKSMNLVH